MPALSIWIQRFSFTTVFIFLSLVGYILFLTPVPVPTDENTDIISGRVSRVGESGANDLFILLSGDERFFYINHGLDKGVDLNSFTQKVRGKQVKLRVSRRKWTPLDPYHRYAPVQRVLSGQEVLFTNF